MRIKLIHLRKFVNCVALVRYNPDIDVNINVITRLLKHMPKVQNNT